VNSTYSVTLAASGGTSPYTLSAPTVSCPALPPPQGATASRRRQPTAQPPPPNQQHRPTA
jgi:hypothetical protein